MLAIHLPRFSRAFVIMAQNVKHPMQKKPKDFIIEASVTRRRLRCGSFNADHNVPNQSAPMHTALAFEQRERENVGGPIATPPSPIQRLHLSIGNERNGQFGTPMT